MTRAETTWRGATLSCVLILAAVAAASVPSSAQAQPVRPAQQTSTAAVDGVVTTQKGTIPLGGAQVVVRDTAEHDVATVLTEGDGRFHIQGLEPGKHTITVTLEGFDAGHTSVALTAGETNTVVFDLPIAALSTTVDVVAPPSIVSAGDTIATADDIGSKDTDRLAPGGGLQAALRLLASVIEVPGGLAIKGGRPTQAATQIGASTLADPGIGTTHLNLPDDAIDSVAVLPNPYAVEYGRFSSGLIVIRTRRAGDQWKIRLNNLDPTFRAKRHKDLYTVTGISSFGPRLELGGPIVKERLYLEQTAQYRYSANDVPSRPENELQTAQWFSSFTRIDANLSPKHSLVTSGALFPSVTKGALLGTFVPPESTVELGEHANYGAVTERALWSDQLIGETTVQMHEYLADVTPLNGGSMELWPDTRRGGFYNTQRRTSSSVQWIETLSGSANGPTGLHLFKVGVDVLHNNYEGTSISRPILVRREDGSLSRRLEFGGTAVNSTVLSTDVALFAQDRVQPTTRWYIEYGGRLDRDGVLAKWNLTPRVGSAVLLDADGTQVVRGGFGLFYERTPSAAGAFDRFESATDSRFASDGMTLLAPPTTFGHVTASDLNTARSRTWDLSYDYRINPRFTVNVAALDRRGMNELVVDSVNSGAFGAIVLSSTGRSRYRELSGSVSYSKPSFASLSVTYARSSAQSDTNAFSGYFDTIMWPIIAPNAYATASSDVPHRLFARGWVMPSPTWLLLGTLDLRSGTPYTVVNDALDPVGERNVLRLPNRARLDVGVEHRFSILKWRPWIGIRAYNALDAFLPSDVQANLGSHAFGTFYNSAYRELRLQIRFER